MYLDPKMIGKKRSTKLQKLIEQGKWNEVNALVKTDPDQLLVAGSSLETLPVHDAVRKAAPLKMVKRMVQAAPDALRHTDKNGRIPLHHVLTAEPRALTMIGGLVDYLLSCDSSTSKVRDVDGNLPLHLACGYGAEIGVVKTLIEAYPDGVLEQNGKGNIPSQLGSQLVAIRWIRENYPATRKVGKKRNRERLRSRPFEEKTLGGKILRFLPPLGDGAVCL
mmetsp:Transcript_2417/g.4109  ORF Transcript_2417/g.4109 Transcript_2417/m.4109 type:complete len:221 (-) Transcript_2417:194-856(-)